MFQSTRSQEIRDRCGWSVVRDQEPGERMAEGWGDGRRKGLPLFSISFIPPSILNLHVLEPSTAYQRLRHAPLTKPAKRREVIERDVSILTGLDSWQCWSLARVAHEGKTKSWREVVSKLTGRCSNAHANGGTHAGGAALLTRCDFTSHV